MSLIWQHRAQLVTPIAPLVFTTTKQLQSWTIKAAIGAIYRFDWGDGTSTSVTGNGADQATTHNYGSAGTRLISFGMWDWAKLRTIKCSANGLTGRLPTFEGCSGLEFIDCNTNTLNGELPSFIRCASLLYCFVGYNQFSGTVPAFPPSMLMVRANNNLFSGVLPVITNCTGIIQWWFDTNQLTLIDPQTVPLTCTSILLTNNRLGGSAVNQILSDVAANVGSRPAAGTLNVSGGTNAAPTGQGLTDKSTIAARPWTCTTN